MAANCVGSNVDFTIILFSYKKAVALKCNSLFTLFIDFWHNTFMLAA